MSKNATRCSRVSDDVNCPRCKERKSLKNGTTKNKNSNTIVKVAVSDL